VVLPPGRDIEGRHEADREHEEDETPKSHVAPGSLRKTTRPAERALLPSRSRLPYYRVWATLLGAEARAHTYVPAQCAKTQTQSFAFYVKFARILLHGNEA